MNTFELLKPQPGLRVLITGAASGIGAAMARAFVQADARVVICDVDATAVDAFTSTSPSLYGCVADVSDPDQVDQAVAFTERTLGGLDLLINNAGIAGPTGAIEEIDAQQWERTVTTNLNGQFNFLRKAVPLMKATSGHASIITMSSVAGRLGYAFRTPYAATKWALVGSLNRSRSSWGRATYASTPFCRASWRRTDGSRDRRAGGIAGRDNRRNAR